MTSNRPSRGRTRRRTTAVAALFGTVGCALALTGGGALARGPAPTNTSPPTITGPAGVGGTLAGTTGTWTGTGQITFTFQWQRCDAAGANCQPIVGETTQSRVLVGADVGSTLRFQVVATDSTGPTTATSAQSPVVTAAPVNFGEPGISGSPVVGATLTTSNGNWTGSPTFTRQWVRCPASGGLPDGSDCPPIAGATNTSYVLITSDAGARLRVRVTASNADGSATAASNATELVSGGTTTGTPVNTVLPAISGTAAQGQTLSASVGTWTGAPTSFAYQWLRCDASSSNCVNIAGASTSSYVPGGPDVGSRLRVRVTATNGAGSAAAQSSTTAVVTGTGGATGSGPPVNSAAPTISGTPARGRTLTASSGTWTGAPTITFLYQWMRCQSAGTTDCVDIAGETDQTYVLVTADVGRRIRVEVTARNSLGSENELSAATAVVTETADEDDEGGGTTDRCDTSIAGAVQVAGRISIPSTSVSLPEQLLAAEARFTPNPVRSKQSPFRVVVRVEDTRGCLVRDALVFVRSVPIVTSSLQERPTGRDGTVSANLTPRSSFPLRDGRSVQFFVRVRKPGDPVLTGVGTRRLVQVRTEAP
jgi:hypothetical protein